MGAVGSLLSKLEVQSANKGCTVVTIKLKLEAYQQNETARTLKVWVNRTASIKEYNCH